MTESANIVLLRPAPLWMRALAQVADLGILVLLSPLFGLATQVSLQWGNALPLGISAVFYAVLPVVMLSVWGATPGKMLLGLRVVAPGEVRLGWRRAWNRQALFQIVPFLFVIVVGSAIAHVGPGVTAEEFLERAPLDPSPWAGALQMVLWATWISALVGAFRPDRRGLHDLWSGTVVVLRRWRPGTVA
ncbi:MAG: RDD family protein [Fibrobacteria bacterium]|nr:RDD family protein [Fibrobacteria bacterium]